MLMKKFLARMEVRVRVGVAMAMALLVGGGMLICEPHYGRPSPQQLVDTILDCYSSSGKWVWDATSRPLPWNVAGDVTANQCDERHVSQPGNVAGQQAVSLFFTPENWTVRNELKWVWRTSDGSCPWVPFNREHMCRLIGKRNVLLVGDSINHEIQWTFVNHLSNSKVASAVAQSSRGTVAACRRCISEALCSDIFGGEGFQVGFIRNDRGAHYEDDQHYMEALSKLFHFLRTSFPNILVIYRNTPTAMGSCTEGGTHFRIMPPGCEDRCIMYVDVHCVMRSERNHRAGFSPFSRVMGFELRCLGSFLMEKQFHRDLTIAATNPKRYIV